MRQIADGSTLILQSAVPSFCTQEILQRRYTLNSYFLPGAYSVLKDSFLFVFASFFIYNSVKTYAVNKKKNIFVKIEGAAPNGVAVVNCNDFVIRR